MKKIYLLKNNEGRYITRRFSNKEKAQECADYFNRPDEKYVVVSKNSLWITISDEYYYLKILGHDVWDFLKTLIESIKDCFWTLFVFVFRIVFFPFFLIHRYHTNVKKNIDKEDYKNWH